MEKALLSLMQPPSTNVHFGLRKPSSPPGSRPATQHGPAPNRVRSSRDARPVTAAPLIGPATALPSERAAARRLQDALLRAFGRSPLSGQTTVTSEQQEHEWRLLDMCTKQLVKLLSTRCLEWSHVLELIRSRLDLMMSRAFARPLAIEHDDQYDHSPLRQSPPRNPEIIAMGDEAHALLSWAPLSQRNSDSVRDAAVMHAQAQEVAELREQLRNADERATNAELRAADAESQHAELALLHAKVKLQEQEIRACKSLLDAQAKTLVELRTKADAADAARIHRNAASAAEDPSASAASSSNVLVLLPEARPVPLRPLTAYAAVHDSSAAPETIGQPEAMTLRLATTSAQSQEREEVRLDARSAANAAAVAAAATVAEAMASAMSHALKSTGGA